MVGATPGVKSPARTESFFLQIAVILDTSEPPCGGSPHT